MPDPSQQDPRWGALRKQVLDSLDRVLPVLQSVTGSELEAVFKLLAAYLDAFRTSLVDAYYAPNRNWTTDLRKIAAMIQPFRSGQLAANHEESSPDLKQALQQLATPLNELLQQLQLLEQYRPPRQPRKAAGPQAIKKRLATMLRSIEKEVERVKMPWISPTAINRP